MRILVIALIFSSFFACKMDNIKQKSLVGTYKVSVDMASDKKAVDNLREEIKEAKGIASEKWLLEKLAELE